MSLSKQAQDSAVAGRGALIWEVLPNLWHPVINPSGIVSLGVAENTLMHDKLSKHISENLALPSVAFTYGDGTTGTKRLKNAMSRFLSKHLAPVQTIEPSHITVTNGCSAAIEHASWAFANPGEGLLLGQPYYGTFPADISLRPETKVVPVPFHDVDPVGEDCVKKYEEALQKSETDGTKIAGLILCNPHNPLGRCYSRNTIIELMKLCEKHKIHLISDEIYALSTFTNSIDSSPAPEPFTSVLSIEAKDVVDPARLHVIWGMSKDFGANGIRLGALISQHNKPLHDALILTSIYSSPSSITEHITSNVLEDDVWVEAYIKENQMKLGQQFKQVVTWAKENKITYTPGVNAAFFLWVDLGSVYKANHPELAIDDFNVTVRDALLAKKVFLASGKDFGAETPGWFRIVFSHDDGYLMEGLQRVASALI